MKYISAFVYFVIAIAEIYCGHGILEQSFNEGHAKKAYGISQLTESSTIGGEFVSLANPVEHTLSSVFILNQQKPENIKIIQTERNAQQQHQQQQPNYGINQNYYQHKQQRRQQRKQQPRAPNFVIANYKETAINNQQIHQLEQQPHNQHKSNHKLNGSNHFNKNNNNTPYNHHNNYDNNRSNANYKSYGNNNREIQGHHVHIGSILEQENNRTNNSTKHNYYNNNNKINKQNTQNLITDTEKLTTITPVATAIMKTNISTLSRYPRSQSLQSILQKTAPSHMTSFKIEGPSLSRPLSRRSVPNNPFLKNQTSQNPFMETHHSLSSRQTTTSHSAAYSQNANPQSSKVFELSTQKSAVEMASAKYRFTQNPFLKNYTMTLPSNELHSLQNIDMAQNPWLYNVTRKPTSQTQNPLMPHFPIPTPLSNTTLDPVVPFMPKLPFKPHSDTINSTTPTSISTSTTQTIAMSISTNRSPTLSPALILLIQKGAIIFPDSLYEYLTPTTPHLQQPIDIRRR